MYKFGLAAAALVGVLSGCGNGGSVSPIGSAQAQATEDPAAVSAQSRLAGVDINQLNALAARAAQNPKGGLLVQAGASSVVTKSSTGVVTKALTANWNAVNPTMCLGMYHETTFYMTVVLSDESLLLVVDPASIAMMAPACVDDTKPMLVYVAGQIQAGVYAWSAIATISR